MGRMRLTIRGLLLAVLVCAVGFATLLWAYRTASPAAVLGLSMLLYAVGPLVARLRDRPSVAFWDWFAIVGLVYLAVSLGLNPPSRHLPTTQWLEARAATFVPSTASDFDWVDEPTTSRRLVFIWTGQLLFSLSLALLGAMAVTLLTADRRRRREQARAISDKIIAEDACHEPIKPVRL